MDSKDLVYFATIAMGGEIRGKTKFQKTVYFLGLMTGCIDDLDYRARFYSPAPTRLPMRWVGCEPLEPPT